MRNNLTVFCSLERGRNDNTPGEEKLCPMCDDLGQVEDKSVLHTRHFGTDYITQKTKLENLSFYQVLQMVVIFFIKLL